MNKKSNTIGKDIMQKYPDKIPIVIHYDKEIKFDANMEPSTKFLVPYDTTVGYILLMLRQRAKISQNESLSLLINNKLPPISSNIKDLYIKNKNKIDECLHIHVMKEKTFG